MRAGNARSVELAARLEEMEEEVQDSDERLDEATALNQRLFEQIQQLKAQLATAEAS
eukprot:SAG11_NODE_3635_length_2322_cov_1.254611_3_plen_57_part_00